jgi:hypothetical protein
MMKTTEQRLRVERETLNNEKLELMAENEGLKARI